MKRTILVVDDQPINRVALKKMLEDRYNVEEAENGEEALKVLRDRGAQISVVILDLIMPKLDGYAVLKAISRDMELSSIPVIVASQVDKSETEEKALELGARDFVSKPYNSAVVRKRLANLIELCESNMHIHRIERDTLTGLYSKDAFCRHAEAMLHDNPEIEYLLVATDVERFKLVNDSFGMSQGDELLKFIATHLDRDVRNYDGLCARLDADHFMALVPRTVDDGNLHSVVQSAERSLAGYPLTMRITLKFGAYPITDRNVSVDLMCDRALLAAESIKGQYRSTCSYYDDTIRQKMIREQEITNAMKEGLAQGQFEIYLQPKYDLLSERIAGAEALVRWNHPKLGFLGPGEFVPLFERNGFITELDLYVWDKTCEIVAGWIGSSKKYVPVSVNVSRKDIYQENLPEILTEIVKRHDLRPSQLHLEITESAYTESPDQLIGVVGELKRLGFVVEMDDFGSGYSSLNMLSELPIDILKLDMRFIQKETDKNSSRNILSFVISLAKWMNLLVVAEGVETQQQIDLLRNMDCNYVQGYYYAKPMVVSDFTDLITNSQLADPIQVEDRDWREGSLRIGEQTGEEVMLIVDDVRINRSVLADYFKVTYTIVEADNGEVAYHYIQDCFDKIAVIMLDLVMPVMDGFQLLQKLRANPLFSSIPVIVTSQAGEASEAHAFELGASDYLPKPYNFDIALHRVQNVTARNTVQMMARDKRMFSRMKKLVLASKLDPLTGLFNRIEMERQVREFFVTSEDKHAVFFMVDIDDFKNINDLYGHDRGDEVIRLVADGLRELFREQDGLCRMGGDEFAVFMRAQLDEAQLCQRLERMCSKLSFQIEKTEVSCSIGACASPEYGIEYQDLYHNADVALLTAKRLGKNRFQLYGGESELPDHVLYRNMDWLLDESSDAIVVCDAETYEVYYLNDVACALAGKDKKTCLSQPCYRAIWGQESPCAHCVHISKLTRNYCEHEVQPEGTDRSFILKGKLIDWGSREARIQYIQDNTGRAALLRQMEAISEDRGLLLDLLPGGLVRYDAKTQEFNYISESLLRMLGYSRNEFVDKFENRFDLMIWHEDRQRVLDEIDEQIAVSDYDACEYRVEKQDGQLCWLYDVGHYREDKTGAEYYVILLDRTDQKLAEQENLRLVDRLQTTIDNAPGALCLYRWDGCELKTLQFSRQFEQIVGGDERTVSESTRLLQADYVHPDDLPVLKLAIAQMLQDEKSMDCVFRVFHVVRTCYFWLRMQTTVKRQADGTLLVYALYTNMDELHQLRNRLGASGDRVALAIEDGRNL